MKILLRAMLPATAVMFCCTASAQEPLVQWTAEARVRGEADGRDFMHKTPPNFYSLLRVRLAADLRPVENVRILIQAQDSRAMGEEIAGGRFSTIANSRNLDLHQGYLELTELIFEELSLQAGRMELAYGTERIIGAVGWNNIGRSFDGIRLSGRFPETTVDLFAMNIGESQTPPSAATPPAVESIRDTGQLFAGTYVTVRSFESIAVDLYGLYESNRAQRVNGYDDLSRFTIGTHLGGKAGPFSLSGDAALQLGKQSAASIHSYMLSFLVGTSLGDGVVSDLALGLDYLSGTPEGDARARTFDPAFHTGHKFYGFMDYFISIPAHTRNRGLRDLLGRVTFTPAERVSVSIWGHLFSLAEAWAGTREVGGEIDLVGGWKYNKSTSFDIGLSAFVPGEVMREWYGGADVAFWAYLGISVRI